MSAELWHRVYHSPPQPDCLHGTSAACEYDGPIYDFRVWHRGLKNKVLCNQCSADVGATMRHQKWERET